MSEGQTVFDVQTFGEDHWISAEQRPGQDAARAVADRLFADPQCMGIRIVKETKKADGSCDETVVHCEIRESPETNLEIVVIDDAHLCTDIYDFYGVETRMTISRLCRRYIERVFLTPTEFLHNYRALQNVKAYGNLLEAGVERVAALQGVLPGQSASARRDKIYDVVTKITQRIHNVGESRGLPDLVGAKLDDVLDAVVGLAPKGREEYHALVVLCRDLVQHRSWLAKFERLALMCGTEPRDDVLAMIDGVVADLVYIPSALHDILGFQRNLGQLVCSIAELCDGSFDGSASEAAAHLAVFLPLLAAGRMPQTQTALLDRLTRQICSSQPLDRYDPTRERDSFKAVASKLRQGDTVLGGSLVAEALAKREMALFGPGGMATDRPAPAAPPSTPRQIAAHLAELAAQGAEVRSFAPGSVIFREGADPDHAFQVVSGHVEITTVHRKQLVMLARLNEDAFFGELALFSPMKRTATATTMGGCQLRIISMKEMEKRIESLDPFCRFWVQYLVSRITDLSARVVKSSAGGKS
ncbi:cAMP-binding protein [Paramagnetospirillum magnetotacticum MS-1]|uniref:cAMP-binding protein n=1 Tax=Paramagnetospirillum magnetotacticum MS-1 TaxID=272627 RepID=A0A0C2YK82_PARME|nr:cyclic nucleotide-binding domain-containing protein [Paramagnetospirillum magnetotacticum]KIM00160.1 cAMP-binding protein [Paramagnetospirillum magnetotacticum MS-1]